MSSSQANQKLVVQKYGGASLSDTEKIKAAAERIVGLKKSGASVVVVVSAMGKTTNQLLELSNKITKHPVRRELDMLLTTGERISMALMSMAINDLGFPAVSFTGSQAGILTDDSHFDAEIIDVRPNRVREALTQGKVVVLAGFQGVSPVTKEITTLGRGGTDTSAVAMAAALGASRCEILKDVPAVFSADPNLVKEATPIKKLSYDSLEHMTFWGAKVLNYRSVRLAKEKQVPLYVGPAATVEAEGTWISNDVNSQTQIISINSHTNVVHVKLKPTVKLQEFREFLNKKETPFPQILFFEGEDYFFTGPNEVIELIKTDLEEFSGTDIKRTDLSSVTATFNRADQAATAALANECQYEFSKVSVSLRQEPMGLSAIIPHQYLAHLVNFLHQKIGPKN